MKKKVYLKLLHFEDVKGKPFQTLARSSEVGKEDGDSGFTRGQMLEPILRAPGEACAPGQSFSICGF